MLQSSSPGLFCLRCPYLLRFDSVARPRVPQVVLLTGWREPRRKSDLLFFVTSRLLFTRFLTSLAMGGSPCSPFLVPKQRSAPSGSYPAIPYILDGSEISPFVPHTPPSPVSYRTSREESQLPGGVLPSPRWFVPLFLPPVCSPSPPTASPLR